MICSFSISHYREILESALLNNYEFISFDTARKIRDSLIDESRDDHKRKNYCILRHDIDYRPEWALKLGEIEEQLGIQGTYFFQVCARTYNLRDTTVWRNVHQLRKWGHTVGLHFDLEWRGSISWEELSKQCLEDKKVFSAILGFDPCDIISFHNTGQFKNRIFNKAIEGIHHTYEDIYVGKFKYLSDSQGWYEGCPCKIFQEKRYQFLQLLTHPYIWPENSKGFIADMANMVEDRKKELFEYLLKHHPVCCRKQNELKDLLNL